MRKLIIFLSVFFFFIQVKAQTVDTVLISPQDTLNNYIITYLENNDVGFLWQGSISQDERIGFIGEEYERIRIHFNSVIRNYDNPFEYFIYGKSKVQDNVCEFQGSLIITEVSYLKDEKYPETNTAYIAGDYVLVEDPACLHSGIFRGDFISFVYLGEDLTLYYNDLDTESPSFSNNLFTGEWFHYESDLIQVCNWGDKRIPGAADLDIGRLSFKPSFRFYKNGWENYEEEEQAEASEDFIPWWK